MNSVWFSSAILFAVVSGLLVLAQNRYLRIFAIVFLASGIYYGILGPLYWMHSTDGYFAGVGWADVLPLSSAIFLSAVMLTLLSMVVIARIFPWKKVVHGVEFREPRASNVFLYIGLISAVFVIAFSANRNAFFLVAYQFSDLLVPVIIYKLSVQKNPKKALLLAGFFIFYSVIVGFRYKLALLLLPIWYLYWTSTVSAKKYLIGLIFPALVLVLFSVMTSVRMKFSGIDFSALGDIDGEAMLYGFFAETNIIFGLSSILDSVLPAHQYVYLDPFIDSVKELIPKFIIGERQTGAQIWMVLEGLQSDEGYNSATTYPFFGEYLMMGGYIGYILGCIGLAFFVVFYIYLIKKYGKTSKMIAGGCGLVASVLGFYYVSRGYLPQFTKSLIFVLYPYIYLLYKTKKNKKEFSQ